MKIRNRLFAIIMVLTMTFTYLPGMAFATSDDSADLPKNAYLQGGKRR